VRKRSTRFAAFPGRISEEFEAMETLTQALAGVFDATDRAGRYLDEGKVE
jgi:hypothetical protein